MSIWQRFKKGLTGHSASAVADTGADDFMARLRATLAAGDTVAALAQLRAYEPLLDDSADSHYEFGLLMREAGDPVGAEQHWRQAVMRQSGHVRALNNLAVLCLKTQRLDEARQFVSRALETDSEFVPARVNSGIIKNVTGDVAGALVDFEKVLVRAPDNLDAVRNAVNLYDEIGDVASAERWLARYLELDPQGPDALFLAATYALRRGDYAAGWPGYEHRWSRIGAPKRLKGVALWQGEPIKGKRILLTDEQGVGDQLLFAGCVVDLLRAGAQVTLLCAPKIKQILADSFDGVTVLAAGRDESALANQRFDYQCAIGSILRYFRRHSADFADLRPYLRVPAERRGRWRRRLDALGPGLKVGLSWRGGSPRTGQSVRSIPLSEWRPVLTVVGVHFVNLQYTDCTVEIASVERDLGVTVHSWDDALSDYAETAALTAELDLVISVCTSLVYLSGGLGKPTWILQPASANWTYQSTGESSQWFPTARLFRQQAPPSWRAEFDRVAQALSKLSCGAAGTGVAGASEA